MKRLELIANCSVENEIISALEDNIQDFYYTLLPQIHGKGKTKDTHSGVEMSGMIEERPSGRSASYRMGTATWPEINFLLISYLDDTTAAKAKEAILSVKEKFPREGIKLFIMEYV